MSEPRAAAILRRILMVATLALVTACGERLSSAQLIDRAADALARGDVNAAVIDVKAALQQTPSDAAGRSLYGEILLHQRNLPEAAEQLRRSLDISFEPGVALAYASVLADSGEHARLLDLVEAGRFEPVASDPVFLAARARAELADGKYFAAVDSLEAAEAAQTGHPDIGRTRALVLLQQNGDLEAAAAVLQALLEKHPEAADAWSLYGSVQQAQNQLPEAEAAYARAGELNPYRLPDRLSHLITLIQQGKYAEVEGVIVDLEAVLPEDPRVNYAQARLAMAAGDHDLAVEELDAVLRVSPQHTPSLYLAANANFHRGNLGMAQAQIESFLNLRPGNVDGMLILAAIYLQTEYPARARDLARQVLVSQPENETANRIYAGALSQEGLHDESAEIYTAVVARNPDSPQLRAEYSQALLRAGATGRGVTELEQAVAQAPEDDLLRTRLINARIELGDTDKARADIATFSEQRPDSVEPALLLAKVALKEEDTEGARRHLESVLAKDPGNDAARRSLAGIAMLESDPEQAAALLSEGLDASTPELESLLSLAAVQERRGDTDGMERALRRAIDAYPMELKPRLMLARHLLRSERPGEVVDLLTTVRESYPDDSRLQRMLVGAFVALEQPGAAVTAGRKLASLVPEDPVALRLAARAEMIDGNHTEARALLRKAADITPLDSETRRLLLAAAVEGGDVTVLSEELWELNETLDPLQRIIVGRNRLSLPVTDAEAAADLLAAAHERKPCTVSLMFYSNALLQVGQGEQALSALQQWSLKHKRDAAILDQLGALRLVRGDDAAAAVAYAKYREIYPTDPVAMNNLAWALRSSNPAKALDLADQALAIQPASATILDTRAMALMFSGEYDSALEVMDQLSEMLGETSAVAYSRAQILVAADRKDEAKVVLNTLIDGPPSPEQERARALLGAL